MHQRFFAPQWLGFALLLLLGSLVSLSHAATYYVATTGDNSRSCSTAQTIGTPKQTINNAISCLSAGDTLYIRGGTYNENIDSNNFGTFPTGTSWTNAVTIASYTAETATLNGQINFPHSYLQYIIFDRLVVDGTNVHDSAISGGNGSHHIRFQNGEVRNSGQGFAQQTCGNNFANVIIGGSNWEFLRNSIHDSKYSYGLYFAGQNSLIDGNEIYNNGGYSIQFYNGSTCDANGNIFRNNTIHGNGYNNFCGQVSGMILSCAANNQIYNNVFYSNNSGIDELSNASNNVYYNNTIYNNTNEGVNIRQAGTGAIIRNNIIYANGSTIIGASGVTADHNLTTDPLFVNAAAHNFALQAGSAAIDAGVTISTITTDITGALRPQGSAYDIGAYEFGGSAVPATPSNLRFTSTTVTGTLSVSLAWDYTQSVPAAVNFRLYRQTNCTGAYSQVNSDLAVTPQTYTDSGLALVTSYCWKILAVAADTSVSDYSNILQWGTFYLDPSGGDDGNPGTLASPWKSMHKVRTSTSPGNLVYVRGGTYTPSQYLGEFTTRPTWDGGQSLGTANAPITIRSAPAESAIFDGGNAPYFMVFGSAVDYYVVFSNLTFTHYNATVFAIGGVDFSTFVNAGYVAITNCTFLTEYDGSVEGISDNQGTIQNRGHHVVISGNTFTTIGDISQGNDGIPDHAISLHYNSTSVVVDQNTFTSVAGRGINGYGFDRYTIPATHWVIRRNTFFHVRDYGVWVGQGTFDHLYLYSNTWYADGTSAFPSIDTALGHGWLTMGNTPVATMRNFNTIAYGTPDTAILNLPVVAQWSDLAFNNNDWATTTTTLPIVWDGVTYTVAGWRTATGYEANGISTNPVFTNAAGADYTLQATSPAINAGRTLTTAVGAGSTSTALVVADARFFTDGMGLVTGDSIQIGSAATVTISAINYATNAITLSATRSWADGDGVALTYVSTLPDMGAFEFGSGAALNAPANLTITNITVTGTLSISFSWTYTQGTTAAVNFRIYRQSLCTGAFSQVNGDLALTPLTYTDSGVALAASYCWQVKAVAADTSVSAASNTVQWTRIVSPKRGMIAFFE